VKAVRIGYEINGNEDADLNFFSKDDRSVASHCVWALQ
jgi:hypothetical protein